MIDLVCVNPADVHLIWPQAKGLIRAAIEKTDLSDFSDIEYDVLSGDQLLWLAISDHIEAAATTHLSRNVCVLTACSGHQRERWVPLFAKIEKYAKDEGATTMRIFGRRGWGRVLDGYQSTHVILEKAL